jgi:glucose-1-phosphate thymidylyltransferase
MKGVVLAGGFGTRMLPSTKVINKHLLPVYSDQGAIPMIFYPINTLIRSGINDILIITSDEAAGLIVETLGDGKRFGKNVTFTYKIQNMHDPENPVGIASALKLAKNFTGEEFFAVILGDNFYQESFYNQINEFKTSEISLKSVDDLYPKAHVFIKSVTDPERFGVAKIENKKVVKIVEKPKEFISNYAVTGLYLYTPHVYDLLPNLQISSRGELEVSDINDWYVNKGLMECSILEGYWTDMGITATMEKTQEFIHKNKFKLSYGLNNA